MLPQIVLVVGTRPEAIKLAPVAAALDAIGHAPALIFTGQHPGLRAADHGLERFAAAQLGCKGCDDPHAHVGLVSKALLPILSEWAPALVIVQGDTSSALGGALAAQFAGLPLAHVEAGLRSHDLRRPWPEEEFRIAIDARAQLLFAPTELSAANLRRERVRGRIHITGNSGLDALPTTERRIRCGSPTLLVTCHRRENWTQGLAGVAAALRRIAADKVVRVELVLHPNPALGCRQRALLAGADGISLREPRGRSATIEAMLAASLVLSDSGGMQEEAAALGVPLLVLRNRTERPEAIASGNIELVGTDPDAIVAAVRRRLSSDADLSPTRVFGDGRASERIAAIIMQWLEEKDALSPIPSTYPQQVGNW